MIDALIKIAQEKCNYHEKHNHTEWTTHDHYLSGIYDELKEAEKEIKDTNHVYLEDELGDVLRDYINILVTLTKKGYIRSPEKVIERSLQKYDERITDQLKGIEREETKKRQKKRLKEEDIIK